MIKSIDIPENSPTGQFADGLGQIKISHLGKNVVLAGKNGSGKSRLLNRIISIHTHPGQLEDAINHKHFVLDRGQKESILKPFVPIVPNEHELAGTRNLGEDGYRRLAHKVSDLGMESLHQNTLPYLKNAVEHYLDITHPENNMPEKEVKDVKENFQSLKNFIKRFMGVDVTIRNRELSFDSMPMNQARFSEGQMVLLQFCVAIFAQSEKLKDVILIMDEPENYLHPSVLVDIFDYLHDECKIGQLWIATHSVPLLSYFEPSLIWYMEKGTITNAGRIPERVLFSLLGDENRIGKLYDFVSLPSQFASNRFAAECLKDAVTVMTGPEDPQTNQIREVVEGSRKRVDKIRILDFGAGQGRLLPSIAETNSNEQIKNWLDYVAFDQSQNLKDIEACKHLIESYYDSSNGRLISGTDNLAVLSADDNSKFDIIVMCNVLHEINPEKWLDTFLGDGGIHSLLRKNGKLLIVEDETFPHGEKAYENGFLVLDEKSIRILFAGTDTIDTKRDQEKNRLIRHTITRDTIANMTKETILNSIKEVSSVAKQKIRGLRTSQHTYKKGLEHGFWVQQLTNAQLILEDFKI